MEYLELTRINGCEESLLLDNCKPFDIITESLTTDKKSVILDLGIANYKNIDFFSNYYCKLIIENLYQSIVDKVAVDTVIKNSKIPNYDDSFYCSVDEKVDIVLCWEILNYIPTKYLRDFIISLLKFSKKGTLLHTFIATQSTMSKLPLDYAILNNNTMERNMSSSTRIRSPRYNQIELYKFMPEFKVLKSILHRNGMQEYLFKL